MVVLNDMDRFHLVMDVIDRVPGLGHRAAWLRQQMADARTRHRAWIREHGEDLPEVARLDLARARARRRPGRRGLMDVLVVNAGSSSLKLSLLDPADYGPGRRPRSSTGIPAGPPRCPGPFVGGLPGVGAVGHRVVHGGPHLRRAGGHRRRRCAGRSRRPPTWPRCTSPGPWPASTRCSALLPGVPAVACFDTAFHAALPAAARTYALPAAWRRAVRAAPVRVPRPVPRLRGPARGPDARHRRRSGSGS